MFWNKKEEKEGLPELPPIRDIPSMKVEHEDSDEDSEDYTVERHNLPAFPDSPMKKGFAQAAIKDAVITDESENKTDEVEETRNKVFRTFEMEDKEESPIPRMPEVPEIDDKTISFGPPMTSMKNRAQQSKNFQKVESQTPDIFVKIDKFHSAKKALENARMQVADIEESLRKIRETKLREEQELAAWEKEISLVKNRIKEVTENIFEKI